MSGDGYEGAGRAPDRPAASKSAAPNAVADRILETHRLITDETGTVFRYEDDGAWHRVSEVHLAQLALDADGDIKSNARRRGEIRSYITARSFRPGLKWGRVGASEIPCRNGVLNVETMRLRSHSPDHMLERTLPVAWDAGARCPVWDDCLIDWFGEAGDGGEAAALQEFAGYVTFSHARFKKALMLYGASDTAKSLIIAMLRMLVGDANVCALSVEDMDDPTRRAVIKGKALNVMAELPAEAMIADTGFKTLVSTEDPIFIDEKYKQPEMYVPTAKHVIATNHLPRLDPRTEAVFRRLLLLPLKRVFQTDEQDPDLAAKLRDELPGILRWAVDGAARLVKRGGTWPEVPAAAEAIAEYRDQLNPVGQFLDEWCFRDERAAVPLETLTKAFNKWNSGARNLGVKQLGALLRAAGHERRIKSVKYRESTGRERVRVLRSLCGFELEEANIPQRLYIRAGAATSDETEIEDTRGPPEADPIDDD